MKYIDPKKILNDSRLVNLKGSNLIEISGYNGKSTFYITYDQLKTILALDLGSVKLLRFLEDDILNNLGSGVITNFMNYQIPDDILIDNGERLTIEVNGTSNDRNILNTEGYGMSVNIYDKDNNIISEIMFVNIPYYPHGSNWTLKIEITSRGNNSNFIKSEFKSIDVTTNLINQIDINFTNVDLSNKPNYLKIDLTNPATQAAGNKVEKLNDIIYLIK